jgi:AAA15 family ATPase/GTPase
MKFRVLAVRVSQKFPFIKNLIPGELYQFYHDIELTGVKTAPLCERKIRRMVTNVPKIYNIQLDNGEELDVNIAALLGKNGSGKSSLLEAIYLLIYCIAERNEMLKNRGYAKGNIKRNSSRPFFEEQLSLIENLLSQSAIELCYELGDNYYLIENTPKDAHFYRLENQQWIKDDFSAEHFFYTITVNYSLYGLNSRKNYFWLDSLFHKNDGYKTPLVINPFRNNGVININIELQLAQTRLLSNMIHELYDSDEFVEGKSIRGVNFSILPDLIGKLEISDIRGIYKLTLDKTEVDLVELFIELVGISVKKYKAPMSPDEIGRIANLLRKDLKRPSANLNEFRYNPASTNPSADQILTLHAKYIVAKLYKTCSKYDQFKAYSKRHSVVNDNDTIRIPLIHKGKGLIKQVLNDRSHVTLKLRQAVNALIFGYFNGAKWLQARQPDHWEREMYQLYIDYPVIKKMVRTAHSANKRLRRSLSEFVPAAFVKPEISVDTSAEGSAFSDLSSGEQQMVHSIHGILYHLLNIESVKRAADYQGVNLILDEIELYYHPDFQRTFIRQFLNSLKPLNLTKIKGLNIIFSTHSPFILSDIYHTNVLKMVKGAPETFKAEEKTFGSNIHEMLSDAFFLDGDLIGAHAKASISALVRELEILRLKKGIAMLNSQEKKQPDLTAKKVKLLQDELRLIAPESVRRSLDRMLKREKATQYLKNLISMIGESVVSSKLAEMYEEIFPAVETDKTKIKQDIQQMMLEHDIRLEDLQ